MMGFYIFITHLKTHLVTVELVLNYQPTSLFCFWAKAQKQKENKKFFDFNPKEKKGGVFKLDTVGCTINWDSAVLGGILFDK